jgi:hypothetical protein
MRKLGGVENVDVQRWVERASGLVVVVEVGEH